MKTASALRQSFLDYFRKQGHEQVRSSPLVPQNDPTLLFTNAGMVQFKDVFTGRESRPYKRATTAQKCVRAGGKHNDLENVGRTARHHTFFEMLGNFSFGDYFKADAIAFAWELLTQEWAIDPKRLVITVFGGDAALKLGADDEARALWKKVAGFSDERILGLGMAENFWMMGDTGPQGPCSEIHYFVGNGAADLKTFGQEPREDGTGWMEIWNLVFMQFERKQKDASLEALPKPSIDTGAGLERVAAVVEGVRSNYDTALLQPLVARAGELGGKRNPVGEDAVSTRVLADHARATTFLMADNVTPSNEGRGYVLRRIMRRAIRHGVRLGLKQGDFAKLCSEVIALMGGAYPEVREARGLIERAVNAEDQSFRQTIDRGLKLISDWRQRGDKRMDGATAFKLYDTYGFPIDLTRVIGEEQGFSVDEAGFETAMGEQRGRSSTFAGSGEKAVDDLYKVLREELGPTRFVGYEQVAASSKVVAIARSGQRVQSASAGDSIAIITAATPFYGEAGGQMGDTGRIHAAHLAIEISDTGKPGGDFIVHHGKVLEGTVSVGASVELNIDASRRDAIRANHSATHLLHFALKEVLGDHVAQKGSLVAPDRLRFDFSHFAPLSLGEKQRIEGLVNDEIRKNIESQVAIKSFDEAKRSGAVALFGEKYGDEVRVMQIGSRSVELCGGTHVKRSGDIALFKIISEMGIAQGVRRIEAVTGAGALDYAQKVEMELQEAADRIHAPVFSVAAQVDRLQKELKDRERKIEELQRKLASGGGRDLLAEARDVGGVKVLASRSDVGDPKALREVADQLRDRIKSGVVVLGGVAGDKVALVAAVTADLTARISAGKIIAELAKIVGGKGGGRPEMAQGGGPDVERLDEALAKTYELLG